MVDFTKGKNPNFIIGYEIDDNNNLIVNCANANSTYKVPANEHNISVVNRKMEHQVLNCNPKEDLSWLTNIALSVAQTIALIPILNSSFTKDTFDAGTIICGGFICMWYMFLNYNIQTLKQRKKVLKEYKKYLYYIKNKESFVTLEKTDLDKEHLSINDIDDLTLKNLEYMVDDRSL